MFAFLKKIPVKKILVAASFILNVLGGTGVIPPVVASKGAAVVNELAK